MLLKEIYDKKHYIFVDKPLEWRDAIRTACIPLEADNTVTPQYPEEIITCVEKHGPYIVLVPGVAMPHSTENAEGSLGTAIGFMRTSEPVVFDENDHDRDAQIFFTLCSTNQEQHFANMRRLYAILTNDEIIKRLTNATKPEDLLEIDGMVDEEAAERELG